MLQKGIYYLETVSIAETNQAVDRGHSLALRRKPLVENRHVAVQVLKVNEMEKAKMGTAYFNSQRGKIYLLRAYRYNMKIVYCD